MPPTLVPIVTSDVTNITIDTITAAALTLPPAATELEDTSRNQENTETPFTG